MPFWDNLPLRAKGLVVTSLPVAAILVATLCLHEIGRQGHAADASVAHTFEVQSVIHRLITILLDAQSARDEQHKKTTGASAEAAMRELELLVRDNSEQSSRLRRIVLPAGETGIGPVRKQLEDMLSAENLLLESRQAASKREVAKFALVIGASFGIGLLGGLLATSLFTSGISQRIRRLEENARRLAWGGRVAPVMRGNDEIGRLDRALHETCDLLAKRSDGLRLAIDSARIAIWELDIATGRVRYELAGNSALSGLLGYPETIDAWIALAHPDDRERVREALARMEFAENACELDYRVVGPEGDIRYRTIRGRSHAADDSSGRRVIGVLVDVTELKRKEERIARQALELARSEQNTREQIAILQCVVSSIADGVVVADATGKLIICNPAAARVWGSEMLLPDGKTPCPASALPLARAIHGEDVDDAELFVRPSDGESGIWVSANARPLKSEDGLLSGGVLVFRDVSEQKRAEQQLLKAKEGAEEANHAKSEFLSRMSHELRTPLNSILGFAQVLKMADPSRRTQDCVKYILTGGRHLLDLIDEVLDISRIEAGKLSLSPEPIPLADSISVAIDMVNPMAATLGIKIVNETGPICPQHVMADRQRLQQVLLNLLSNAVKYNGEYGQVRVSCERSAGDRIRVKVSDTGAGIPAEEQRRLFVPFERLSAPQSDVEGTGLGLALSKRLIEVMGGTIGVESEVGVGTTFWIDLPDAESPLAKLEIDGRTEPAASPLREGMHTVLYVEDNVSNLRLMEHILTYRPQIKLLAAMQGRLGFDLAVEHRPELILLDLHLPDIGGDAVLTQLRADERTREIPTIVISADATPGQIGRLTGLGATAYLTKPVDVEKLLRILDENLSGKVLRELSVLFDSRVDDLAWGRHSGRQARIHAGLGLAFWTNPA